MAIPWLIGGAAALIGAAIIGSSDDSSSSSSSDYDYEYERKQRRLEREAEEKRERERKEQQKRDLEQVARLNAESLIKKYQLKGITASSLSSLVINSFKNEAKNKAISAYKNSTKYINLNNRRSNLESEQKQINELYQILERI